MMMYAVMFFEEYVGYDFDEYSKIFKDINKAKEYCEKLNREFAEANMCKIEDLGDYYIIKEVKTS